MSEKRTIEAANGSQWELDPKVGVAMELLPNGRVGTVVDSDGLGNVDVAPFLGEDNRSGLTMIPVEALFVVIDYIAANEQGSN